MKLWVDDVRCPPWKEIEWIWAVSVDDAKIAINSFLQGYQSDKIIINLDHDAGEFYNEGGDYIKLLDWLEETGVVDNRFYFHIHSMNPVGVQNMRAIIQHNGWNEI